MFNDHITTVSQRTTSVHLYDLSKYRSPEKYSTKLSPFTTSTVLTNMIQKVAQRTCCTLLIFCYLLQVSIGVAGGEPQINHLHINSTSKLEASLKSPLEETMRLQSKPSLTETDRDQEGSIETDYIEYIVRQTTIGPNLMDAFMVQEKNQGNIVHENTATVIASSFRNLEGQTLNSKENGGETPTESTSGKKKNRKCQRDALKKCIDGLPPMNDTGLPTSTEAVNTACRIYDSGINCFDTWAKNCLPINHRQKVRASITGAHEMYSFLCKDPKFRSDYLKHKDCYRQLSPYWDDCSRQFIDGLRRNIRNNYTAFCCVRLEFVTCVSKYSSRLCSYEATKFSMKMAETLIRTRTRPPYPDCMHIHPQHCIPIIEGNGAALYTPPMSMLCLMHIFSKFINV